MYMMNNRLFALLSTNTSSAVMAFVGCLSKVVFELRKQAGLDAGDAGIMGLKCVIPEMQSLLSRNEPASV